MIFTNTSNILGYQGESLSREITFTVDENLSDCDIYLEFIKPDGTKVMTNVLTTTTYLVPYSLLDEIGYLKAQIVAYRNDNFIQKSAIKSFYIPESINANEDIQEENPSIINELLDEVANSLNDLDFTFNNETKILTATLHFNDEDTTTKTVTINIDSGDKYITNVAIDYENEVMIFTFNDGTTISCDITPLIDMYSADNLTLKLENGVFSLSDNYKNQVDSNTVARHTHSNKTILDNTTASFTTEWKTQTEADIEFIEREIDGENDLSTIEEYSSRETANGNFFIDGSSSTLHSVKGKSIKSKNQFDKEAFASAMLANVSGVIRETVDGRDCIRFDPYVFYQSGYALNECLKNIKSNTQYNLQLEYRPVTPSTTEKTVSFRLFDIGNNNVGDSGYKSSRFAEFTQISFHTRPNTTVYKMAFGFGYGYEYYIDLDTIQLEEGTTATEYIPYFEGIKHSHFAGLNEYDSNNILQDGITFEDTELKGIGTAKDELNFDTNKKITRIGSVTFNGTETWVKYPNPTNETSVFYTNVVDKKSAFDNLIGSKGNYKYAIYNCNAANSSLFDYCGVSTMHTIYICGRLDNTMTVAEWIAYLADNPITFYYELDTPIETDFTFEDNTIQAFIHGTEEIVNSNSIYGALTTQEQSYPSTIISSIANLEKNKVDVIEGKCLSTNDFTNEDKTKLDSLEQVITALTGTSENPIYFQDLETGNYVLNGRYKPYESASISGNATNQFIQVNRSSSRVNVFMVDARSEELECFEIQIDTDEFVRTIIPIPEINLNKMPVDDAMDGIYAQMQNQLKYENSVEQTLMIDISFPTDIPNNYYSKLVFKTGSTIPTFNLTGTVKWLGDSITGNQLILQANKIYTINFEKDVFELVARVEMR